MNRHTMMPRTLRFQSLLAVVLALLFAAPAYADQPETAEQWLQKLAPAMSLSAYRGVFVYARGEQVNSMQIAHRFHDGEVQERLVQLDGESGEIVRKGERIFCVLPDHGRVKLDQIIASGPFAEPFARDLAPDGRWYQASLMGESRVAGHETVGVALDARDEHRYSYQLWLEKDSGLLVKSHVQTADGKVLERFQFTTLEIVDELPDSEFELQSQGPEVERRLHAVAGDERGRLEGWHLNWRPDGFSPSAVPRSGNKQAVAFSDGLATFSVFVESVGTLVMPTGASRIGATTAYMRYVQAADQGFLVTVVGEIPPATAMRVAESVEVDSSLSARPQAELHDN